MTFKLKSIRTCGTNQQSNVNKDVSGELDRKVHKILTTGDGNNTIELSQQSLFTAQENMLYGTSEKNSKRISLIETHEQTAFVNTVELFF